MRRGDEIVRGVGGCLETRGVVCVCVWGTDGEGLMCDVSLSLGETKEGITGWDPPGSLLWHGLRVR